LTDNHDVLIFSGILSIHLSGDYYSDARDMSVTIVLIDVSGMELEAEAAPFLNKSFAETLRQELDELVKELNSQNDYNVHVQAIRIGTATALVGTLSIGYVTWLLRGGILLTALLSHMPAWCSLDPLPVLENWKKGRKNRELNPDTMQEDEEQKVQSILG
jgi:hypothetical protein